MAPKPSGPALPSLPIGQPAAIVDLQLGGDFGCVLCGDGRVRCWGDNRAWQLGAAKPKKRGLAYVPNISDARVLAVGTNHACVIRGDETVHCWGFDSSTQLGRGAKVENGRAGPGPVKGLTQIRRLAAGGSHTCALDAARQVFCWGESGRGAVGHKGNGALPQKVALPDDIEQIVAGSAHSCARRSSGQVLCWGDAGRGQLGPNRKGGPQPQSLDGLDGLDALFAGGHRTCVRLADGQTKCMGRAGYGGRRSKPWLIQGVGEVAQVVMGHAHMCARTKGGGLWCWGRNHKGQLGDGTRKKSLTPVKSMLSNVVRVAAGGEFSCAVTGDGAIHCWGDNDHDQLLRGGSGRPTAEPVEGLPKIVQITAAMSTSCARTATGAVWCWGEQLGSGKTMRQPQMVGGISQAVQLELSEGFGCARIKNGNVRCFGENDVRQLGDGTEEPSVVAVKVKGLSRATKIRLDFGSSCALVRSGRLMCWGSARGGLLGRRFKNAEKARLERATAVAGLAGVADFDLRGGDACAVIRNGTVKCWGVHRRPPWNCVPIAKDHGGCATVHNPQPLPSARPTLVAKAPRSKRVLLGADSRGWLFARSGDIHEIQLGPEPIANPASAPVGETLARWYRFGPRLMDKVALEQVAESDIGCRLGPKGTVLCKGGNQHGQLGDGSFNRSSTDRTVLGIAGAVAVASGSYHHCALLGDGVVWCWGNNAKGQLGPGLGGNLGVPVPIDLK